MSVATMGRAIATRAPAGFGGTVFSVGRVLTRSFALGRARGFAMGIGTTRVFGFGRFGGMRRAAAFGGGVSVRGRAAVGSAAA